MTPHKPTRPDYAWGWDNMTREHMVEKMERGWRNSPTPCGTGSSLEGAYTISRLLPRFVEEYEIDTLADMGAGDLFWMAGIVESLCLDKYAPYDLVVRHKDVTQFDITTQTLPHPFDLILCRHVLNHISPRMARDALQRFKDSGSTWLLMTNCPNQVEYWKDHALYPLSENGPVQVFHDVDKWQLELYRLADILPVPTEARS